MKKKKAKKLCFLHVGCGAATRVRSTAWFASDDWQETRLDATPDSKPDIVDAIVGLGSVADASYDAVYSSHDIGHLYHYEVPAALAGFRRVIKAGGHLVISCHDLAAIAERIAHKGLVAPIYISPAGPVTPLDVLYGMRSAIREDSLNMAVRFGFDADLLSKYLHQAGFSGVLCRRDPLNCTMTAIAATGDITEERLRELAEKHLPTPTGDAA